MGTASHTTAAPAPGSVDWLIIHQFDAARTSPGGIDTVIRGILRHTPPEVSIAVVGVDTTPGGDPWRIGRWEQHRLGDRTVRFLPVVSLDPADQTRRVPHTLRLVLGLVRHLHRLPRAARVQCHRMDTALAALLLVRRPLVYLIHTQVGGSTGRSSDSFWRFAGALHPALERFVVRRAADVRVFSPERLDAVRAWNPVARASPTWWDPGLVAAARAEAPPRDPYRLLWVGRVEKLKDPDLAVAAFARLVETRPQHPWSLHVYGPGTRIEHLRGVIARLPPATAGRVHLHGRVEPAEVARAQACSGVFLMTSFPGYEGFPTVIVESLAAGLPVVVTEGADPGGVVVHGVNGFVTGRDPGQMARRIEEAVELDRAPIPRSVDALSAPAVVGALMTGAPVHRRRGARGAAATLRQEDGTTTLDGLPLETGTTTELVERIDDLVRTSTPQLVITANVDQVLNLRTSPGLRRAYEAAALRMIDGMPLVLLARALGAARVHRHTGADLLPLAAEHAAARGWRVVITGGSDEVAAAAVERLRTRHPAAQIHHVPFPRLGHPEDPASVSVVERLREQRPDVVFLCLGSPKQEVWFLNWRDRLPGAVYVGAGAAVDFAAGTRSRAPGIIQSAGLEWAWRLFQEPRRLAGRYLLKGPRFLGVVVRSLTGARGGISGR